MAIPTWCMFELHAITLARPRAKASAGNSIAASTEIIATTTSNSIKVNAWSVESGLAGRCGWLRTTGLNPAHRPSPEQQTARAQQHRGGRFWNWSEIQIGRRIEGREVRE